MRETDTMPAATASSARHENKPFSGSSTITLDTGLAHYNQHRLYYQPATRRCFCFACTATFGFDLHELPEEAQAIVLRAVHSA